ncbi:MAG: hypothetical protein KKA84_02400 [Bacteroidetes bacterium]|nr:hypothetical protein [Bacteroidota bacterium]
MTAQMQDTFIYKDEEWELVGINGQNFFSPEEHDLKPYGCCSACWGGYLCTFKIAYNKFVLDKLDINHATEKDGTIEMAEGPLLNGVKPEVMDMEHSLFNNHYKNLNYNLNFTGGILIAKNFIDDLYVHMGYPPPWKYKEVVELIIDNGNLQENRDVSKRMKEIRNKLKNSPLQPGIDASKIEIKTWIEESFKLDYNLDDEHY